MRLDVHRLASPVLRGRIGLGPARVDDLVDAVDDPVVAPGERTERESL